MSTGPQTQAAFIQGNQNTVEHDVSHSTQHSALFYLFQEVSKLASPNPKSFLDRSPSVWLNETSTQGPFMLKKEEEEAYLFQISNSSCQLGLSQMTHYNQMKKEESHSSNLKSYPECNSPWKVLSLINLQCEKLLHHSDEEESNPSSLSSAAKLSYALDKASSAAAKVADRRAGGGLVSVGCTFRPSLYVCEKKDEGVFSEGAAGYEPQSCVKDSTVGCCVQSQTGEKINNIRRELVQQNTAASSRPQDGDDREDKLRQSQRTSECKKDCFSSEQVILNLPFSENAFSQTFIPNASLKTELVFNSNEHLITSLSKPSLKLDQNANVALTTDPPCDVQLYSTQSLVPSSLSACLSFSITDESHSLPKQGHKVSTSKLECTKAPIEKKTLLKSSFNGETHSSSSSKPEPSPVQKEESVVSSTQQWRTKTPRKQPHPSRSADIQDPDFQGVTFRIDTEMDDSKEQCRLLITSKYSKELWKSVRKPRLRTRTSQKSLKTSSSDEESELMTNVSKGKVCASCCTRKTPMWRDAEDGTPLCNACGIRYKKYRVRCVNCWHIPRKEGNSNSCCLKCGNFVRLTSAQRKHAT